MGFLWLMIWFPFYDVPSGRSGSRSRSSTTSTATGGRPRPAARRLAAPRAWLPSDLGFIVAKFLTDPVWWFFLIWLPAYFLQTRGLDIKKSWIHLVTIYVIVTVLSIAGGWLTGAFQNRGWTVTRARKTGMFLFALCVLPILLVTRAGDWSAVLLIGLAGAAHQAWSANLFTTTSDVFPKKDVGTVTGLAAWRARSAAFSSRG